MPIRLWKGLSKGAAMKIAPCRGPAMIGLWTEKSPILDSLGQPAPGGLLGVSAAYWAGVQTPRPEPTEGLIVTPSGSVTSAFRTGEGAVRWGSLTPLASTRMSKA